MLGVHRYRACLAFLIKYVLASYVFGLIAVVLGGSGHGFLWPVIVWLLMLAPTSLFWFALWKLLFPQAVFGDSFGFILLLVVPVVNGLVIWWVLRWVRRPRPAT